MQASELMWMVAKGLILISVVMGFAAYAVLLERKVAAYIQGRPGPNRTQIPLLGGLPIIGPILTRLGVFQPAADGPSCLLITPPLQKIGKQARVLATMIGKSREISSGSTNRPSEPETSPHTPRIATWLSRLLPTTLPMARSALPR